MAGLMLVGRIWTLAKLEEYASSLQMEKVGLRLLQEKSQQHND
jgi:hypothetical protein